jgi:hypothetical protein
VLQAVLGQHKQGTTHFGALEKLAGEEILRPLNRVLNLQQQKTVND